MAPIKFGVFVDENYDKLPTLYWLPKHIKSRFIVNFNNYM